MFKLNEQGRALPISIKISGTGPFGKVFFFFFRTLTGETNYGRNKKLVTETQETARKKDQFYTAILF